MDINEIVRKIINLPRSFKTLKNASMVELLKETGYFQVYNEISVKYITKALEEHPQNIDEWIAYSEDKRTSSGYYLKKEDSDYIVGYLSEKNGTRVLQRYNNMIDACAKFIKLEIEEIRL